MHLVESKPKSKAQAETLFARIALAYEVWNSTSVGIKRLDVCESKDHPFKGLKQQDMAKLRW